MLLTFTTLAITDSDIWVKALTVAGIAIGAYLLALWVAMLIWTIRDASSRTPSWTERTMLVSIVAFFNLPGLILYLALRPQEHLVETFNRHLEAEAFLHDMSRDEVCARCQTPVEGEYLFCPTCRAEFRSPCAACHRPLRVAWTMCPYCAQPREEAPSLVPRVAAAQAPSLVGAASSSNGRKASDGVVPATTP